MPGELGYESLLAAADHDAIIALVIFLITVVSWVVNQLTNKKRKVPPVVNRPRPPARPRDQKLQDEISIFMQETTGRKPAAARPARQAAAASEPRRPAAPPKPARRAKPGAQLATRQAPVTGSLGSGVKQHLNEYMSDKVTQQVQQRLAPRVEDRLAEDLGTPVTTGASRSEPAAAAAAAVPMRPEGVIEALRSPVGLRQAMVLNLILARPGTRPGARPLGR